LVAPDEDVEVHRVESVRGGIGEATDVPRGDRIAHPLNEVAPIGGCADVPQSPEARARQAAELWIADAEEA